MKPDLQKAADPTPFKVISADAAHDYYQALLDRNPDYEGIFFVGVTSTGVFCRPTCPARKPKFENCEFFHTAELAALAGYRPCQRCRPLSHPDQASDLVQRLLAAVEANPEKRWKDTDFEALCTGAATARRHFKKRFGMSFVQYARARRMGIAFKQIRKGQSVIDAQLDAGYESGSGFRDAFSKIMGSPPAKSKAPRILLKMAWFDTRLGPMCAIADEQSLFLLEFVNRRGLEREIETLRMRHKAAIIPGQSPPIQKIQNELQDYFEGTLQHFKTPIYMHGSPFQKATWQALQAIPYGQTRSYAELARSIGNPQAFRAVANANGANPLAIIVPCHRIINSDGAIGGYGGGPERKQWLISHERAHCYPPQQPAL